jgi:hypothetical protein
MADPQGSRSLQTGWRSRLLGPRDRPSTLELPGAPFTSRMQHWPSLPWMLQILTYSVQMVQQQRINRTRRSGSSKSLKGLQLRLPHLLKKVLRLLFVLVRRGLEIKRVQP